MTRKVDPDTWDREKKPKKTNKYTDKASKHRKSIYNMLSEYDEELYDDSDESDVYYDEYYKKQR